MYDVEIDTERESVCGCVHVKGTRRQGQSQTGSLDVEALTPHAQNSPLSTLKIKKSYKGFYELLQEFL